MEQIATKTLAEIYLQQGHLQEAYEIFKALAEKDPLNQEIQKKLEELRERLQSSPSLKFYPPSKEARIRLLKKWLDNIRRRRTS